MPDAQDANRLHFSGTEHFDAPVAAVWNQLTNLEFTAKTLPGLERVDKLERTRLECRVKPGFSFLAGSLKMIFEIVEELPMEFARMRVSGKAIGASIAIVTDVRLSEENGQTRLDWSSDVVELGGLMKAISRGLIEGAAKKLVQDSWSVFRLHL